MTKYSSKGTALLLNISSVYTVIPGIDTITAPPQKPETTDTTSLDSGVGRENKPNSYAAGGTATGSLFFDPQNTVHKTLLTLLGAPSIQSWKITWSDALPTSWLFNGTLTDFASVTAAVGEFLKSNIEIQLDGVVTFP